MYQLQCRHNVQQLSAALQLPKDSVTRLLSAYPAALDMSPATVASRATALAQTLQLPQAAALEVACKCPRLLGLSPQHVQTKLDSLQNELQLPSRSAAVELVVAFPQLLGLSSVTLAAKWRRLQGLAKRNALWQQQLSELLQQRGGGCLGRMLAAGPGVVDRLQYVLDAQSAQSSSSSSSSSRDISRGSTGSQAPADLFASEMMGPGWQVAGAPAAAAATLESTVPAAAAAGALKPVGELRLTTLLLQSEAAFTARHPDFVLWRLKQRSR
jgi:hypothetical protein